MQDLKKKCILIVFLAPIVSSTQADLCVRVFALVNLGTTASVFVLFF